MAAFGGSGSGGARLSPIAGPVGATAAKSARLPSRPRRAIFCGACSTSARQVTLLVLCLARTASVMLLPTAYAAQAIAREFCGEACLRLRHKKQ